MWAGNHQTMRRHLRASPGEEDKGVRTFPYTSVGVHGRLLLGRRCAACQTSRRRREPLQASSAATSLPLPILFPAYEQPGTFRGQQRWRVGKVFAGRPGSRSRYISANFPPAFRILRHGSSAESLMFAYEPSSPHSLRLPARAMSFLARATPPGQNSELYQQTDK